MIQRSSSVKTDYALHAFLFLFQMLSLLPGGFMQEGTTPAWIYPCWLILSTVTIFRQGEVLAQYDSHLIFIPSMISCGLYGLCLINEFTRDLWAFAQARNLPVFVRIIWYQLGVLLIHPQIYPIVWNRAQNFLQGLWERGYFARKIGILAVIVAMILWLIRSQNISPDGYDWLEHSAYPLHWVRYLREPLGTYLFFLFVYFCTKVFHWVPYVSISVLTILCGIASAMFLRRVFRYAVPQPFSRISLLLLFCSYGYMQIFAGNIEIYALLHLGLSIFLYLVVRYLEDDWSVWVPGIAFGVLFCLHLSVGWWIPAFLLLPYLKYATRKSLPHPIGEWLRMLTGFTAFVVSFGLFVLFYGYQGDGMAMWNHFWGDQVMNVGADGAMFRRIEVFFSFDVYLAMFNEYSCMFMGGILLLIVVLSSRPSWRDWTPFCRWNALLVGMYAIYSIVWNPDRHFPADWDLFSGITIPAVLLVSQMASRLPLRRETVFYLYYQSILFSGLYLLIQLYRNHIRITGWPEL